MYVLLQGPIFESVETDQREEGKNRENKNHFSQKKMIHKKPMPTDETPILWIFLGLW